jgi:hypothetical protein
VVGVCLGYRDMQNAVFNFFSKPIESVSLLVKVRLNESRSQGARIESVPLKRLVELSKLSFHSWRLEKIGDCWWLVIVGI